MASRAHGERNDSGPVLVVVIDVAVTEETQMTDKSTRSLANFSANARRRISLTLGVGREESLEEDGKNMPQANLKYTNGVWGSFSYALSL